MIACILRVVRGVRRACDAVEELLDRDLRPETAEDAEIVRRVAAEARADRLERELRRAREELERVAESVDARDELRRMRAN